MDKIYEELYDEDLVQLGRDGDPMAFEQLFSRYKTMVNSKARAYFLAGADKDDLLQEGMIGLFKAMRDFDGTKECKFGTFAEICVTRQIITAVSAAARRKHTPLNTYVSLNKPVFEDESQTTYIDLSPSGDCDPEVLVLENERREYMKNFILNYLSDMEKKVLHYYLNGLSYSEIANKACISVKSTDNALQRIKRKLGRVLAGMKNS
jgi:RNA polymerase sporulation-specific sigma factor